MEYSNCDYVNPSVQINSKNIRWKTLSRIKTFWNVMLICQEHEIQIWNTLVLVDHYLTWEPDAHNDTSKNEETKSTKAFMQTW